MYSVSEIMWKEDYTIADHLALNPDDPLLPIFAEWETIFIG
jgi:hypothetical protein